MNIFSFRSWSDIAVECEMFLGPKGYKSVQVSPPNEHVTGSQWWTRYQPVTYNIISRSGTEAQFIDMVKRCAAVNVDIIVDAVHHFTHIYSQFYSLVQGDKPYGCGVRNWGGRI